MRADKTVVTTIALDDEELNIVLDSLAGMMNAEVPDGAATKRLRAGAMYALIRQVRQEPGSELSPRHT